MIGYNKFFGIGKFFRIHVGIFVCVYRRKKTQLRRERHIEWAADASSILLIENYFTLSSLRRCISFFFLVQNFVRNQLYRNSRTASFQTDPTNEWDSCLYSTFIFCLAITIREYFYKVSQCDATVSPKPLVRAMIKVHALRYISRTYF